MVSGEDTDGSGSGTWLEVAVGAVGRSTRAEGRRFGSGDGGGLGLGAEDTFRAEAEELGVEASGELHSGEDKRRERR